MDVLKINDDDDDDDLKLLWCFFEGRAQEKTSQKLEIVRERLISHSFQIHSGNRLGRALWCWRVTEVHSIMKLALHWSSQIAVTHLSICLKNMWSTLIYLAQGLDCDGHWIIPLPRFSKFWNLLKRGNFCGWATDGRYFRQLTLIIFF